MKTLQTAQYQELSVILIRYRPWGDRTGVGWEFDKQPADAFLGQELSQTFKVSVVPSACSTDHEITAARAILLTLSRQGRFSRHPLLPISTSRAWWQRGDGRTMI